MAWCHQATSHSWANAGTDLCHHMASLDYSELTHCGLYVVFMQCWQINLLWPFSMNLCSAGKLTLCDLDKISAIVKKNQLMTNDMFDMIKNIECVHDHKSASVVKINSLAPGKFEWNFRSLDLTYGKSTLVQVMAWCRQAASYYLSQCWPRSFVTIWCH